MLFWFVMGIGVGMLGADFAKVMRGVREYRRRYGAIEREQDARLERHAHRARSKLRLIPGGKRDRGPF